MTGTVFLVGAGPGDPRLLTLRGAELLQRAAVVVHDRLAPSALLDLAPSSAELVDVGKAPGSGPPQSRICEVLVDRALRGLDVVRLKGGDPFVFGRGGEEALACARAGVPFEVVPGVSAAIAAPAAAGIPVTHRGVASSFAVVTATLEGGTDNELARVAGAVDTLVVLMAAGRMERVCRAVVAAGRDPDEPAAAIQWATTSEQRTVAATLSTLPALAREAGMGAPATLVIGPVVDLAFVLAAGSVHGGREGLPTPSSPQSNAMSNGATG
ncbi:MAG: uroporphyrinogen-III C-methyltransferase [Actinomycetota bacterium]